MILDGKKVKEERLIDLKKEIDLLDRKPGIAVIQVGNNEASNIYIKNKEKTALTLGCNFNHIKYEEDVNIDTILNKIDELNKDKEVDGIIVQMPLPDKLNKSVIQNRILPSKDIDGLTDINMGLLSHNKDSLVPCTAKGILELLKYYNIDIKGKHVVVVGRSDLVGKPVSILMLNNNATVSICHSYTDKLETITRLADILIVAVGKPNIITSDMIKDNAVIIDVAINRCEDKLCGDVNYSDVKDKASYITPVPGGVGQMTLLALYENLLKAYKLNN